MLKTVQDLQIAVLQTGRAIEQAIQAHGDYDAMCKRVVGRTPGTADTFAVLDGEFPTRLDLYDVIVVTGSKHGVYEDHPWIAPLEALLRKAMAQGKKVIAICFGHQVLAQALGGRVEKSDKGLGVGLMDYDILGSDGTPAPRKLYAWHQDQVVTVPVGAHVIARSDFCPIAGLRYGDQAISFQPHPEFTAAYMRALIDARSGSSLGEAQAAKALASLEQPCDSAYIQAVFKDFMSLGLNLPS